MKKGFLQKKQLGSRILALFLSAVMAAGTFGIRPAAAANRSLIAVPNPLIDVSVSTNAAIATSTTGLGTSTHTEAEIQDYILKNDATVNDKVTYAVTPSVKTPYAMGKLSDTTQKKALALLNQIRYVAGLPEVKLDTDTTTVERIQAAALVNALIPGLSHTPANTMGMADALFQKGYQGSGQSNLAKGYSTLNDAILSGWMDDGDSYNIDRVGHRRWILNPSMGKTVFGAVGNTYSMYSFDRSGTSTATGVAWPAHQMPLEFFGDDIPWSYSLGSTVDISKVAVKLTCKNTGKVWNFSQTKADGQFYVNNDAYGQSGCIIFLPEAAHYSVGDVYQVQITGLSKTVNYTVSFIERYADPGAHATVSLNWSRCTLPTKYYYTQLEAYVSTDKYTGNVTWSSSNPKVASVDQTGRVTPLTYGKAIITAKLDNGATASAEIQTLFYDVSGSNDKSSSSYQYYYDPVYWAADNGITKGYDGGVYFGPEKMCERREMLIFLWRIAGCPTGYGDAQEYFNDLENYGTSTDTNKAIAWGYRTGITKGYDDGGFHPTDNICRKDTLIMLYRVAKKPAVSGEITFPDVLAEGYHVNSDTYKAILWASQKKITGGYSDGNFQPLSACLREHIVTFLYRYQRTK